MHRLYYATFTSRYKNPQIDRSRERKIEDIKKILNQLGYICFDSDDQDAPNEKMQVN